MERKYSDSYAEIYRKHWWWRAREEVVIETLRRYCPSQGWDTILDIGCGDGLLFDRLAEFGHVEGLEPEGEILSDKFLDRIHVGPFDERFQPGKQYSLILMLDVLEHLPDARKALSQALELLVPGGTLLVTVPAFQILWTKHDDLNHHVMRFKRSTFRKAAKGLPLEIIEERYLFQALFPAKLLLRGIEASFRLPQRVPSVPPFWINNAARGYMRFEERVSRLMHPAFGSSLLVVARKSWCGEASGV